MYVRIYVCSWCFIYKYSYNITHKARIMHKRSRTEVTFVKPFAGMYAQMFTQIFLEEKFSLANIAFNAGRCKAYQNCKSSRKW